MRSCFLLVIAFLIAQHLEAQDHRLYWKYKDYNGAVSISVPGFALDIASLFVEEKSERRLVRKIDKIRILVFEDMASPVKNKDILKFRRRAARKKLDELITIRDGKTYVSILAKEKRSSIRKAVVLVQSPESFVLVGIHGLFRFDDINKILKKYDEDAKEKDKPVLPSIIKIPVSKV